MSSIKKRDDGKWRARYRDAGGREHARHFDRKVDAQQWLDQVTASVVTGMYVDPKAGKVTVANYAKSWEALQVSSASTRSIVDNALRLHLLPELGALPMSAVRASMIQSVVKKLEGKSLSPRSIRVIYSVAAMMFAAAVDDKVIPATPCRRIKLPKPDGAEVVPPTIEQVEAMEAAVPKRWRAVVVTLAGSGLRIGELLGLQVSDVDFLRRTIRVERQRNQSGAVARPKSETSRRTVAVGQVVVDTLAAHLAAFPSDGALFCRRDRRTAAVPPLADHLGHRCQGGGCGLHPACPEALRSIGADLGRRLGQAGPDMARALIRGHHPAELQPPVARRR